jgi:predicted ATP-grasp superfamily ATP-dependent carboligase
MKNILLLDAGGTNILAIAETLYKKGFAIHAFCENKWTYGYHTRYVKKKVTSPNIIKDEKRYLAFLQEYINRNRIDVIIPMDDHTAALMSKYKSDLPLHLGNLMPDYETFCRGYNKNSLMSVCRENGIPHPRTIDLESINQDEIGDEIFPALIKPNFSSGARGITLVKSKKELENSYSLVKQKYGSCHLQEFIQPGGAQIEVQLLVDKNNKLLFSSVIHKYRWYPVNGGSSCCNISVKNDSLVNTCYDLMKALGWQGFADFDTIKDPKDGIIKVMELNPRIPACVKTSIKSGVDWSNIIVNESLGKQHEMYKYETGTKLRHIGFEILWFFYSKDRFKTNPNWFHFLGKDLYFQDFSWADPLPFIFGTVGNIRRQMNFKFRAEKNGMN